MVQQLMTDLFHIIQLRAKTSVLQVAGMYDDGFELELGNSINKQHLQHHLSLQLSLGCAAAALLLTMQKIFSSTMAATGRQLKQSVKIFQSLILYLSEEG